MFQTPILFIAFNRPQLAQDVFDRIKKVKPQFFFMAVDSPRSDKPEDVINCELTRDIVKQIDWECEIKTLFPEENRGCGFGPAEAITWFFRHVEMGIILEDDCLPHLDFFKFCEELLEYYKFSNDISFIGGTNHQNGQKYGNGSYYFSAGNQATWGWATWRRTWSKFDYYISELSYEEAKMIIYQLFDNQIQRKYWLLIFEIVKRNRFDETCWDYQFYFSCWQNKSLAIIPNQNLITNIGFDSNATHTTQSNHPLSNIASNSFDFPLIHPTIVNQEKKADFYLHRQYIQPYEYGLHGILQLPYKFNNYLKQKLGKKGSWMQIEKNNIFIKNNK